jgi:hypothetical protein
MFAPMVNPYDLLMTNEERRRTWNKWTRKRKLMYFLARRFPRLLSFFYQRSFLSGKHGQIDRWLSLSLGSRVREALLISFLSLSQHVHIWLLVFCISIDVHFGPIWINCLIKRL